MKCPRIKLFAILLMCGGILSGCATVLPSEYGATQGSNTLPGPVLALAGEGDTVVAANPQGVHVKKGLGNWVKLDVPGIADPLRITSLAVREGEICVGTDGEGLHVLSGNVWEVRTARYGGLPDDHVLSIAFDGPRDGLPGENLWVGTERGLAVRSSRGWRILQPGDEWLQALAEEISEGSSTTFIASGYGVGARGEDSQSFKPPVSAISSGPGGVVLGGSNSSLAMISPKGLAVVQIREDVEILDLLMEENVIWVATNGGLVWGGLSGKNLGTPWPAHRRSVLWGGNLFATRDARPFLYEWRLVGYNAGKVHSLAREKESLWVAYGKPDPRGAVNLVDDRDSGIKPITDLRRYLNIDDYISRKEAFAYETYNEKTGVQGNATMVLFLPETGSVWVGSKSGLFLLKK